jgi:hypothetical protein
MEKKSDESIKYWLPNFVNVGDKVNLKIVASDRFDYNSQNVRIVG